MTDTSLVAWLTEQLDDDYETDRLVLGVNAMADVINGNPPHWVRPDGTSEIRDTKGILIVKHTWSRESDHITRWDPARALAEVDAKRQILALHAENIHHECGACNERQGDYPCQTIRLLAVPLADRPGYQDEWRPTEVTQ